MSYLDVLIYGVDKEECFNRVQRTLDIFSSYEAKVRKDKSISLAEVITYLGAHIICRWY